MENFDVLDLPTIVMASLRMRELSLEGEVLAFDDKTFSRIKVYPNGMTMIRKSGLSYSKDVKSHVGRLLDNDNVVGFTCHSDDVYRHLQQVGRFEYKDGAPVKFRMRRRAYHVF